MSPGYSACHHSGASIALYDSACSTHQFVPLRSCCRLCWVTAALVGTAPNPNRTRRGRLGPRQGPWQPEAICREVVCKVARAHSSARALPLMMKGHLTTAK